MKPAFRAFVVCGVVALGLIFWQMFHGGSHVRDTPFTREYNQVHRLIGKLVLSELPPPKGASSKSIEAFVAAGILSTNDAAYIREHGIEFYGFDGIRTGVDVVVFETICTRTKPPRRITGYADGHVQYREVTNRP